MSTKKKKAIPYTKIKVAKFYACKPDPPCAKPDPPGIVNGELGLLRIKNRRLYQEIKDMKRWYCHELQVRDDLHQQEVSILQSIIDQLRQEQEQHVQVEQQAAPKHIISP